MNCKAGDRAVIVRGMPLNLGRVVRVVEAAPDVPVGNFYIVNEEVWRKTTPGPAWVCESLSGCFVSSPHTDRMVRPIKDAFLMPLPPESECLDTEILTIKEKEYAHD